MKALETLKARPDQTILIGLIAVFLSVYLILSYFPKHGDFFSILYFSSNFAQHGLGFIDAINGHTDYPPTFFVIQGTWLKLGTILFNFNLNNFMAVNDQNRIVCPTFIQMWAMIPYIVCLATLVAVMYKNLKNKWLVLLCFGTFTFVTVIIMGQIDIFLALFIGLSMLYLLKTCNNDNYKLNLIISFFLLGMSVQFKTFGILLFPVYVLFFYAVYLAKGIDFVHIIYDFIKYVLVFVTAAFFIWIPFIKWFVPIYLTGSTSGEYRFLFAYRLATYGLPQTSTISIWFIGYLLLLYLFFNIVRKDYRKIYKDQRYPIFFVFATLAWFFISAYTHPQWWIILLPVILLILDNFKSKLNYILAFGIMSLFIYYPMMWTSNIDKIISMYFPVISISEQHKIILTNLIISILGIWILELYYEISGRIKTPEDNNSDININNNKRINLNNLAPLVITIVPFVICLIAVYLLRR
ncbi:MAG: hypothetical protein QG646_4328 [Euryarchaeota archaeon]|nr:hypothetical protein [Euryarchaeota archaeon]